MKKEKEREELHRAIWAIADDLRGAVDGWDFKNYVLGTMFYRYISENLTAYINEGEIEAGNTNIDYAILSDKEAEEARADLVHEKGFFILPSELFCNVRAKAMLDDNLNETLERVFNNIEESAKGRESENSFAGLFDDFDVNSNKLGSTVAKRNERLAKLLDGVAAMNLGSVKDHDFDAFGDAYEYLMTMYASNAGKSGGEFFTPADVSELLTRLGTVGKKTINKVYDPACGSGSLLLKAVKLLGKGAVTTGFYGQEINITTYNLCRINMFLHDIGFDKFDLECEDTLTNPQHWDDEPFELIVSNPPYSIKWAGDENPLLINDPRFSPAGVLAPKSKADLAFIMHSLSWLASNGTAAIVCFPGIMFRGGAEQKIRQYLIDNNYVDCVIQLPSNLFFGTSIATCIMVMKKNKNDNKILFIDASNECIKVTNNNKLTSVNIERIVTTFANREEIKHFSHLASYDEVVKNDYNLSVSTYVEQEDKREVINIKVLNDEIKRIVARSEVLRAEIDAVIAEIEVGYEALFSNGTDAPMKRLGDTCSMKSGKAIKSVMLSAVKDAEHPYPCFGGNGIRGYIAEPSHRGDYPIIGRQGALCGNVNYATGTFYATEHAVVVESLGEYEQRYLFYLLTAMNLNQYKSQGAQPGLAVGNIQNLVASVPSLEQQRKVVEFLDRFDALCNNISIGLPAEIAARQNQYEFYRDKLLTFKELS
ncbi:type I restriction-modification system subunit M [Paenibacillus sp. FSL H8-0259]